MPVKADWLSELSLGRICFYRVTVTFEVYGVLQTDSMRGMLGVWQPEKEIGVSGVRDTRSPFRSMLFEYRTWE